MARPIEYMKYIAQINYTEGKVENYPLKHPKDVLRIPEPENIAEFLLNILPDSEEVYVDWKTICIKESQIYNKETDTTTIIFKHIADK